MRHRRSIVALLLAGTLVLIAAAGASAKGDAIVTLDAPLPTDPAPGSTITLTWRLDIPDGAGSTVPLDGGNVFVRFTPPTGAPLEVMARQLSAGHYRATVTVPAGGLGSPVFGLKGESCFAGSGCERSDILFRVATEPGRSVPDPVAAPIVPVATVAPAVRPTTPAADATPVQTATSPAATTPDLTLPPLVALIGLAAMAILILARLRGRIVLARTRA